MVPKSDTLLINSYLILQLFFYKGCNIHFFNLINTSILNKLGKKW